jgi:hypothetical protein
VPTLESLNYNCLYCLFKGEPGLRKSGAALSFPKPIYFFDWDQKMEALGRPMKAWGINPKDVAYDSYKDWNAAKTKLEQFQTNCPYKTLVIDSITSCADAINRQTLKLKMGGGETGKRIAGIPVNSIEDFNAEDSALKELVALTKDIHKFHKVNVILIAHVIQKEVKSADGKTHMSRTLVTAGKGIAQKIPAYCGEVYHFNIETGFDASQGGQYALLTQHTGDDFARSSLELPGKIIFGSEPLYDKWLKPAIDKMNEKPETEKPKTF